ncbi:phosphoglycerol transferase MdoB-like AlkP superfamily enzyme [Clostridium punense]|uniref:Phosphoglycerol transferase MdoB-like AlkP superfamily enzyme n=1 Tax=Clostridium punense TaxID=1054297 RepID=A0ABS4K1K8_9CLOT|nr:MULTISPECIES: hypothetical protein [Clostridium]EQB88480.1 hypothetical protein M918_04290 [Clostridium sp. BL8]MBP2020584.1 phosphoglycerol transferase MdoB-like AlkP superfamily enzyme [Clostridium punense]
MLDFIDELEGFTKKIVAMVLGLISTGLFLFINYKGRDYAKTYDELGFFNFITEVGQFRFFLLFIVILISLALTVCGLIIAFKELVSQNSVFEKIISLILFLTLIVIGGFGAMGAVHYLKVFGLVILGGILFAGFMLSLAPSKDSK